MSNDNSTKPTGEPSLGPACLVISVLFLACSSAFCAFGSYMVFFNQYPMAAKSIEKQLIPWVETSQMAREDKLSIVQQLQDIQTDIEASDKAVAAGSTDPKIDKTQLGRLRGCLQDNPVLLWGAVQAIQAQAAEAGLTETEQETLTRVCERLMRSATDRVLGRRDLEFTIVDISKMRSDGMGMEVKSGLTADEIRSFMKRAEPLLEKFKVPNEPYDVEPAEAFRILVEKALDKSPM